MTLTGYGPRSASLGEVTDYISVSGWEEFHQPRQKKIVMGPGAQALGRIPSTKAKEDSYGPRSASLGEVTDYISVSGWEEFHQPRQKKIVMGPGAQALGRIPSTKAKEDSYGPRSASLGEVTDYISVSGWEEFHQPRQKKILSWLEHLGYNQKGLGSIPSLVTLFSVHDFNRLWAPERKPWGGD
ncbi:hypothetical protein C8J55DRAFT_551235 [Lentinula edodes]|uniref:Uncharacterized protein n=1 Tax=Lentinula lateritia TaxID=40482 RepID=A0A9W9A1L2_9AGAR|nr:hypothetical protein C8J55DRAFT_551235 [Lentinula edodes]